MKISLVITRISLAIALILAIATLPHHHHHGEPCWGLEEMACDPSESHSHTDVPTSTPCSDNHCYLQAMKTFLLAERVHPICPICDLALFPDAIVLSPDFFISNLNIVIDLSCLRRRAAYTLFLKGDLR
ncbi:hypothetical protein EVA_05006 [gut metagenome]|uniref:Uncharacterized protein n=1 Tax=gut metagenome TaxID=749906 RepID=J9GHD6_9ZZZZ